MLTKLLGPIATGSPIRKTSTVYDWAAGWQPADEGWTRLGDVSPYVSNAGELQMGAQQSGALVGTKRWRRDSNIIVRGSVRGEAAALSKYFAGLALFNPDSGDTNYYELCVANSVPPFTSTQGHLFGSLTNEAGVRLGTYTPGQWRDFLIMWEAPSRSIRYFVDGILNQTVVNVALFADPTLWLGCVSVGEGVSNDGSAALATFGRLEVIGVPVG